MTLAEIQELNENIGAGLEAVKAGQTDVVAELERALELASLLVADAEPSIEQDAEDAAVRASLDRDALRRDLAVSAAAVHYCSDNDDVEIWRDEACNDPNVETVDGGYWIHARLWVSAEAVEAMMPAEEWTVSSSEVRGFFEKGRADGLTGDRLAWYVHARIGERLRLPGLAEELRAAERTRAAVEPVNPEELLAEQPHATEPHPFYAQGFRAGVVAALEQGKDPSLYRVRPPGRAGS